MATATTKKVDPVAIAAKLYTLANNLQKTIDDKRRPMTQNSTPKRQKEYMSRKLDGDNLERGQRAMRALADAWLRGDVPAILQGLRTKAEIVPLVRHGIDSSGYYDVHSTGKYADQSPEGKALQALVDNSKSEADVARDAERDRMARIERMENELRGCDIPGFFPTPRPLIERMFSYAKFEAGCTVLEPSAGKGDILDALKECYPTLGLGKVSCCEIRPKLREILEAKGHSVVGFDFLEHVGTYDRIIANPPYEQLQDVDHIQHAYRLLNPGGRLVSLMGASAFFRQDRKASEFRTWLDMVSGDHWDAGEYAFKGVQAFRQTGVRAKVVVVDKP